MRSRTYAVATAWGMLAASLHPASAQTPTVSISPAYAQMQPGQAATFTATVSGGTDGGVVWQVNNATGGTAATGTITQAGQFTAPASLPAPASVTITAVSAADPGVSATATITLVSQAASGTTFYVATTGADTNPGTLDAPFRTIGHAATVAVAGDTVLVRGGVYKELVAPTHSGSAAKGYITFSSFPGETATIDGTGLAIPQQQWGLITLNDVSYVVVQGFELRNYTTTSVNDVPIGVYIFGSGSNLQIVNNHIHNIETTAKTNPNQCGSNALGLVVYGTKAPAAITGLVISGNEIDDLLTGCSESMSIDGNVDGFAVTSNRVHNNDNIGIDAIGFEKVSPNATYDQARRGEIRGNTVYNITSYNNPDYGKQYAADGIYVDGGTQIVIEQNLVHNVDLGIELASEHKGHVTSHVTARNNVVYANNATGISIGGYAGGVGGTQDCTIVNNTLFDNDTKNTGSGEFQIQFHASGNVFRNNILYATRQALMVNNFTAGSASAAVLDDNLYYSPLGAANSQWVWSGKTYTGFAAYQKATKQDAHAAFANPLFDSLATPPDLDILAGSPAIGAGDDLGASIVGVADFNGNPRTEDGKINIGAYEK
jgi:hypothetical protein